LLTDTREGTSPISAGFPPPAASSSTTRLYKDGPGPRRNRREETADHDVDLDDADDGSVLGHRQSDDFRPDRCSPPRHNRGLEVLTPLTDDRYEYEYSWALVTMCGFLSDQPEIPRRSRRNAAASGRNEYETCGGKTFSVSCRSSKPSSTIFRSVLDRMLSCITNGFPGHSTSIPYELTVFRMSKRRSGPPASDTMTRTVHLSPKMRRSPRTEQFRGEAGLPHRPWP
jgi:hypothetical protein